MRWRGESSHDRQWPLGQERDWDTWQVRSLLALCVTCSLLWCRRGPLLAQSLPPAATTTTAKPAPAPPPLAHDEDQRSENEDDATALAKKLQNLQSATLYSFPFQNNTNFNYRSEQGTLQDILNVQPVIPIHINEDWNVITRTILPLIWQPSLQPGQTVPFGTGPTTFSAFLSPKNTTNGWLWGVGPVIQIPRSATRASAPTFGAAVRPACWST